MRARYTLGPNTAHLIGRFSLPLDPSCRDIFNMALVENRDLYIENISDIEVRNYRPA